MLQTNTFSRFLNTASTLSLSAVLLGVALTSPNWAMEAEQEVSVKSGHPVHKLGAYADLASQASLPVPAPKPGDLVLLNVGHGLVHSCTRVSARNTEAALFAKHGAFIGSIKKSDEADYTAITTQAKLASGNELVKVGEKGLPAVLNKMSASGISIIPISSRGDDGMSATEGAPKVLSRTEKEFLPLFDWENWKKPVPFQNLNESVPLRDHNPADHGTYKLRNGIIYSTAGETPHKSAAIVGLVNILKEKGDLPSAIYMTDRKKTIDETSEDLKDMDLGVPLYLLSYTQPQAFLKLEDLVEFYIHRLGEVKFENYKALFEEAFGS